MIPNIYAIHGVDLYRNNQSWFRVHTLLRIKMIKVDLPRKKDMQHSSLQNDNNLMTSDCETQRSPASLFFSFDLYCDTSSA